jgi:hypothetical protein
VVAGAGIPATSALLNGPNGLTLDPSGNLYVSDAAAVTLSSNSNAAIVPASVTVPAGATSATVTVTPWSGGGTLPQFTSILISATLPGTTLSSGTRVAPS